MIAVGDLNIAPLETDVWSHKQLLTVVSHTPVEVGRLEDLPSAVRRAVQLALTPPTGPVFLALPLDLQMADVGAISPALDWSMPRLASHRVRPPTEALGQAAGVLATARNPATRCSPPLR